MEEKGDLFTVMLPLEVRVMIYKKLRNSDMLAMRTVNQQIKSEIDEHVDFHITLDQSYRKFRRLCQYHVESMKVNLLSRQIRNGIAIKYPSRVKKIIFDGFISVGNLSRLLTACNQVEHLVFTHETLGMRNLFKSESLLKSLSKLQCIKHLNLQFLRYPASNSFEDEYNISAFLNLTLPALHTFKLFYSVRGNWTKLMLFLQRHAETLKCVELQAGDQADSIQTRIYLNAHPSRNIQNELDMSQLLKMKLREFRFRDDVLFLNGPIMSIFFEIISKQTQLEIFHFYSPGDFTVRQLKALVEANAETISEISISNLKSYRFPFVHNEEDWPDPLPKVDLVGFQRCRSLKYLALSCASESSALQEDTMSLVMFNIHCLPSTLETIQFRGFKVRTDEIVQLSRKLPNLKEFVMVDAGRFHYSAVINNLLKYCRSLEYLNIRPVIAGGSNEASWWTEVKALNLVFNHFMSISFDIDDLDGLEARIGPEDKVWIEANIPEDSPTVCKL